MLLLSHQRDPVLAAWRYGLGRSVAFTSDAKAKWGVLWVKWDEYNKLFGQMLRWSLRTTQRREVVASVVQHEGRGEIQLEAVDEKGDFINFVEANTGVVLPDKTRQVLPLVAGGSGTVPGRLRGLRPGGVPGGRVGAQRTRSCSGRRWRRWWSRIRRSIGPWR